MNERIEDLIAVYALGGLSAEEQEWVEYQVAGDAQLAAQLDQALQVTALLAFAAAPLDPSPAAEADLFARIDADMEVETAAAPTPQFSSPVTLWSQLKRLFSSPAVSGAALTFAAVLLIWAFSLLARVQNLTYDNDALINRNSGLQAQVDDLTASNNELANQINSLQENKRQLQAEVDEMAAQTVAYEEESATNSAALAAAAAEIAELEAELAELALAEEKPLPFSSSEMFAVTIPGTELQPQAEAQLVVDPQSQMAMLVVTDMDELPENSVYQVLLIRGTEHETAETFRVNTEGEGVLLVSSPEPINSFDAVGVSIEPEGGSVQRTGDIVLLGNLIN